MLKFLDLCLWLRAWWYETCNWHRDTSTFRNIIFLKERTSFKWKINSNTGSHRHLRERKYTKWQRSLKKEKEWNIWKHHYFNIIYFCQLLINMFTAHVVPDCGWSVVVWEHPLNVPKDPRALLAQWLCTACGMSRTCEVIHCFTKNWNGNTLHWEQHLCSGASLLRVIFMCAIVGLHSVR